MNRDATPFPAHDRAPAATRPVVHPLVRLGAAYSWRLLVIGLFVFSVLWLAGQLLVVLVPLGVAALLTRALTPVSAWLRARGMRPALAAAAALLGFLLLLAAALGLVGWAVADELDQLRPTLREAVDDVTDWLVEDSPFDVSRAEAERWRAEAGDALAEFVRSGGGATGGAGEGAAVDGAILVGEVLVGIVLALVVTFFLLKDGERFVGGAVGLMPARHRPLTRRALDRAWDATGGYLKGAALLGVVEGLVIGITLVLVGAELAAAVVLITFLAAFVPLVGAIVAGIIAVLVALVTAGTVPALITAVVAIIVQQLDNDLLAPVVYSHAVRLHPLVVLLGIAAGGSLFGFVGTVFAVPVLAVVLNAFDEVHRALAAAPDPGPGEPSGAA